ncbi:2'-5' RNA ligase family protein [Nonomuraea sp. NPDC005650]|uniref:2'-5' RNA ligase family protein n=1 Tax=Nonomuraea sp. NPDC005650 TaxID=3157045 RepID=UPI0033A49618
MAQAVEMFFDDQADQKVRRLWEILADHGLPSLATLTHRRHRPHVSLTVAETLNEADLDDLRSALTQQPPALNLDFLGTFPGAEGVLFAGVAATTELLAFHRRIHAALPSHRIKHWPYYFPDKWIPHCTLAIGLNRTELSEAMDVLHGFEPIAAAVSSIGITETTTGTVTPLLPSGTPVRHPPAEDREG